MLNDDMAFTPASEQARLIATKQVSPVDLAELYFSRIERLDSQLNAYLTLMHDEALETARAAEQAVVRGDELGPLHGLPISIKDTQLTRGTRTTSGSLVFKDRVPDEDTIIVERIRKAGAVFLGKTNASEFGMLGINENRLGDHCRNPWNTERTTGASSGGAGAAMAAGLCSLATGGDDGGSIRIPSSYCGLFGLKTTQGRSPFFSTSSPPAFNCLAQSGPMSRTVRDSAMVLQAIAGHDPRDPSSLREAPPDFLGALDRDIKGLRFGWSLDFGYAGVDPEVADVTSSAARAFEDLGCTVDEAAIKLEASCFDTWWTIHNGMAYCMSGGLLDTHKDQLTWYATRCLEHGASQTGADYALAMGQRDLMIAHFSELFEKFDLLLSPTMSTTAIPVDNWPEEIGGKPVYPDPSWGFLPFTHPINTIGFTASTVPCGFSADGLPIGLHIIGKAGDEETVMAASAAFERARPWAQHRPPVS